MGNLRKCLYLYPVFENKLKKIILKSATEQTTKSASAKLYKKMVSKIYSVLFSSLQGTNVLSLIRPFYSIYEVGMM